MDNPMFCLTFHIWEDEVREKHTDFIKTHRTVKTIQAAVFHLAPAPQIPERSALITLMSQMGKEPVTSSV